MFSLRLLEIIRLALFNMLLIWMFESKGYVTHTRHNYRSYKIGETIWWICFMRLIHTRQVEPTLWSLVTTFDNKSYLYVHLFSCHEKSCSFLLNQPYGDKYRRKRKVDWKLDSLYCGCNFHYTCSYCACYSHCHQNVFSLRLLEIIRLALFNMLLIWMFESKGYVTHTLHN